MTDIPWEPGPLGLFICWPLQQPLPSGRVVHCTSVLALWEERKTSSSCTCGTCTARPFTVLSLVRSHKRVEFFLAVTTLVVTTEVYFLNVLSITGAYGRLFFFLFSFSVIAILFHIELNQMTVPSPATDFLSMASLPQPLFVALRGMLTVGEAALSLATFISEYLFVCLLASSVFSQGMSVP